MTQIRCKTIVFVLENSLLLLVGTAAAVLWANLYFDSYDAVAHPLHFWVNEIGMVFFFALAAKEVFEATLPGGSLASPRQALAPLTAAVGGMVGPALIFIALASAYGPATLVRGGRFRAQPTSPSPQWWHGSSSHPPIPQFRSCSCWRSPTTSWAS